MKPKFTLRISSPDSVVSTSLTTSSTPINPTEKKRYTRHLSLSHEKEQKRKREAKRKDIEAAVEYCRANGCKGYKAIADLGLADVDARTINSHLEREVVAGRKQKILTDNEEKSLVRYIINRNRACQGLNDKQIGGVVLNILRVRLERNRRLRGINGHNWQGIPLSEAAKKAIDSSKVSRSFFRRFRTAYPEVRPKSQHKVSLKRGLRCTKEMAIDYIDELAKLLIQVGIAPDLKQTAPGIWVGPVNVSRIWAHDETPQFINFNASGQSKKKVYAGSGHDCSKLSKENRESVTVQPFSNFAGEVGLVQVIFAGSGLTSHMCPANAAAKIPNLLVSVNESGCSTGDTLFAAYQELSTVISKRRGESEMETNVVIADGHKSRFDIKLMRLCDVKGLDQFILWPDTSGATQKHDQINAQLHSKYEEKKSIMYTEYSDVNRECFMNILSDVITEWATKENLTKAGKRVGITNEGLSVEWMDQSMFERAAAVLHPESPMKTPTELPVTSPEGVRKNSAEYWKSKYDQAKEFYSARQTLEYPLEQVEGLLPYKKVKPAASIKKKITDVHGSLKATEVRELIEQKEEEERQKEERRKEKVEQKENMVSTFLKCKEQCLCKTKACKAMQLQQCSVCRNVLKSKCTKKACKVDGEAPAMILVAARKDKSEKTRRIPNRRRDDSDESEEELDSATDVDEDILELEGVEVDEDILELEGVEDMWSSTDESFYGFEDELIEGNKDNMPDLHLEAFEPLGRKLKKDKRATEACEKPSTSNKRRACKSLIQQSNDMNAIRKVQANLDEAQNGQYFCVFYDDSYYWGKCLKMFSEDVESSVDKVEIKFMHRQMASFVDETTFWDWPKQEDIQIVPSKFIFFGPCMPALPTERGFTFADEIEAMRLYRVLKNIKLI